MAIGMSVTGATDLGLGSTLAGQAAAETDEQRRKRLLAAAQQRILPGTSNTSAPSDLLSGFGAAIGA
jgi:hypothetical protein